MAATSPRSVIPWIFVGAMAFVVAVNAGMVTVALRTFPGLAHDAAFERGLAYNQVLAEEDRQENLGWALHTEFMSGPAAEAILRVRLHDRDGQALSGARIVAALVRPVEREAPIHVELHEGEAGTYSVSLPTPRSGQWDARVRITRAGVSFATAQRLFIR